MRLEEDDDNTESDENEEKECNLITTKNLSTGDKRKRGIVYLSSIPRFMNVTKLRDIFSEYGKVDRIFLQPEKQFNTKKKKKPAKHFTEGWVEFEKKRVAKDVALLLNSKQIGGRKRSKFYDFVWNVKYLPRFKWVHLSERLAYERAVHKQRMSAEISQAKREANYFSHNVELKEHLAKHSKKNNTVDRKENESESTDQRNEVFLRQYTQRETDSEIRDKKSRKAEVVLTGKVKKKTKAHKKPVGPIEAEKRDDFLKSLFGNKDN